MGSGWRSSIPGGRPPLCAADTLARCGLLNEREEPGGCSFFVSDRPEVLPHRRAFSRRERRPRVEQIDIEEY